VEIMDDGYNGLYGIGNRLWIMDGGWDKLDK